MYKVEEVLLTLPVQGVCMVYKGYYERGRCVLEQVVQRDLQRRELYLRIIGVLKGYGERKGMEGTKGSRGEYS